MPGRADFTMIWHGGAYSKANITDPWQVSDADGNAVKVTHEHTLRSLDVAFNSIKWEEHPMRHLPICVDFYEEDRVSGPPRWFND